MGNQFDQLEKQLEKEDWPSLYLFKFIAPSDNKKIAMVTSIFNENSDINMRPSKKGTYTSISVKEVMMSAENVIKVYKKAAKIKGVIII
ncbi:DUF493 domain-containing protein [Brumimicrobium salinarum]|uniref:DUF493 domain-containing protein n=1 Tax=Brumimicrobium salinarum TaxID=2058658 RepID=A0A2I0R133_9FLAO|nr:DUF493 family protein [Brumimicrobium salinarum]PKR80255.1 DUF493 domain-containing protein [Brumimicrobium salinarum]